MWLVQAVLAGMSLWILGILAVLGTVGMGIAYLTVDHVSDRIDKFLTGGGDTYQIDKALDCFRAGGFFGVGPGEGQMKFRLPEPQTDYIFSVIGEEFGMIACLVIAGLYIAIVVRVFLMMLDEEDPFVMLAAERPCHPVRPAGDDQHGGQSEADAVQGHDPAVHQPRRLVVPGAVPRHGPAAGADPAQSVPQGLALCRALAGGVSGRPYILAAGGTGGHMVPAHVLALELRARGHDVHLVTDTRGLRFPGLFEGVPRTVVDCGSPGRSGWRSAPSVALSIWRGRGAARALFRDLQPRAVIGFGGYPALPSLLAALSLKLPSLIHEQNAVLGRVNRFLAPRVARIATSYARVRRMQPGWAAKTTLTGNPVRAEVIAARAVPFDAEAPRLHLLVTGGSQGAAVLNTVVPAAVALLPESLRAAPRRHPSGPRPGRGDDPRDLSRRRHRADCRRLFHRSARPDRQRPCRRRALRRLDGRRAVRRRPPRDPGAAAHRHRRPSDR